MCDEIPITQYFESAAMFFGSEGDDLFKVVAMTPTKNQFHHEKKVSNLCSSSFLFSYAGEITTYIMINLWFLGYFKGNKGGVMRREEETNKHYKEQKKKPKCVDEDLYKISPELLYKIPKKASTYLI